MASIGQNPPVLLAIINFVDIKTLLNLRLLCKSVNGLMVQYQKSICERASQALWHCPPGNEAKHLVVSNFSDMVRLHTARRLAIRVTQSWQYATRAGFAGHMDFKIEGLEYWGGDYWSGIQLSDPRGNGLCDRVTRGFMLLHQLSTICTAVQRTTFGGPYSSLTERLRVALGKEPTPLEKAQEKALAHLWLLYAYALPLNDLLDFLVTVRCLSGKLRADVVKSIEAPYWLEPRSNYDRNPMRWLIGYLLRQGPAYINKLWSEDSNLEAAEIQRIGRFYNAKPLPLLRLEELTNVGLMQVDQRLKHAVNVSFTDQWCRTAREEAQAYMDAQYRDNGRLAMF